MCDCKECDKAKLNPEPTDVQRATYRRHQRKGTSPGNPKWYKKFTVQPFVFVAGKPPVFPRIESGAEWRAKNP